MWPHSCSAQVNIVLAGVPLHERVFLPACEILMLARSTRRWDATCPDLYCLNCSLIYSVWRCGVCAGERTRQAQLDVGNKLLRLFSKGCLSLWLDWDFLERKKWFEWRKGFFSIKRKSYSCPTLSEFTLRVPELICIYKFWKKKAGSFVWLLQTLSYYSHTSIGPSLLMKRVPFGHPVLKIIKLCWVNIFYSNVTKDNVQKWSTSFLSIHNMLHIFTIHLLCFNGSNL